jgi:hypothetical protein
MSDPPASVPGLVGCFSTGSPDDPYTDGPQTGRQERVGPNAGLTIDKENNENKAAFVWQRDCAFYDDICRSGVSAGDIVQ